MIKNLYSEPLTGFSKNAHKRLAHHQNKSGTIYQKTVPIYDNFMKIMKGKMLAIKDQVKIKPGQVIFSQTVLKSIIETIIFCGRQALSLRGDDPQFHNSSLLEFPTVTAGSFLELTLFRVAAGDEILKKHILKAPSNAKYMPKTIQNELICLRGGEIATGITSEVKESRVLSILADEVRDCSNTEQMSFVIRYVDKSCQIREEFIQFLECESGTSRQELFLKIVNAIRNLALEISNVRGQGYDGAGNIAGKKSGVSSRIFKLSDKALYVHCFNHRLNLVIAKSCNIQKVRNLMGIGKEISYFLNLSPKREKFLKDVKKLFDVDATKEKLIDVCLTRWVARSDGLVVFETFFTIIVYALEKIKDNANPDIHFTDDTSTKASNLNKSCYNFDFVVALVITRSILSYTSAVTELLQKKSIDILQAYQVIKSVKAQFHDIRANVDIFHEK